MSLRILHCIHSLNATDGGPARSVPALAAAEASSGAEVRLWSADPPTIDVQPYESVEFVSGTVNQAISDLWTPDVIHDHGLWLPSNHSAARLSRHKRIPRVISPRGMLEPWCMKHRRYRKLVAWQLYQHRDLLSSACLHATSENEAEQFRQLGFKQPVVLLPNGVTLPTTPDVPGEDREVTGTGEREVLFLSRIHPVKGLPHLIEAWAQAVRPGWRLRIVGSDEGGHRSEIQRLIEQKQLSDTVRISDAVHSEGKWKLLREADVVVLPSFSENFGIVIAEALAVDTPVITTTGTPWENVLKERCGWYAEPGAQSLSLALQDAMGKSQRELKEMGVRGGRWVRQEYAWDDIGKKMLDAYDWLLVGDHQPGCVQTCDGMRRAA
jgi:glycosyltransferase involved in cell wall biosynthesis